MEVPAYLAKSCMEWDLAIGVEFEVIDKKITYYFQRPISEPRYELKRERVKNSRGKWHSRTNKIWTRVQKVRCVEHDGDEDQLRLTGKVYTFNEFKKKYLEDEFKNVKVTAYRLKNAGEKKQDINEILAKVTKYYKETYSPPKPPPPILKPESEPEVFVIENVSWAEYVSKGKSWGDMVDEYEKN